MLVYIYGGEWGGSGWGSRGGGSFGLIQYSVCSQWMKWRLGVQVAATNAPVYLGELDFPSSVHEELSGGTVRCGELRMYGGGLGINRTQVMYKNHKLCHSVLCAINSCHSSPYQYPISPTGEGLLDLI